MAGRIGFPTVRPWMTLALVSASIAIFYGVVVLGPVVVEIARGDFLAEQEVQPQAFESEGWRRQGASYDGTRQAMVEDLLAKRPLLGTSEGLVVELLGEPNAAPWQSASSLIYRLGPEPGPFSIDNEWLILDLESGHVSRVSVATD